MRKRDWEVITGWEKRIKVDFGSIGPNHVRWSDWTHKERDIVARKVHESAGISKAHGPRSRRMDDWAKENEPVMIGFARDHKPMPDWAHADYRESGIPEHVKVVWKREKPNDMASHGNWAYDPPGPWKGKVGGIEWSSRPMEPDYDPNKIVGLETEGKMDPKFGGVVSYKTMANGDHVATDGTVISTAESRAKEDVPQWRKFELGRLEILDNVVIPGPNALPKDEDEYGKNRKLTKAHKTRGSKADRVDPAIVRTVQGYYEANREKANKGLNWLRVLKAFGATDADVSPFTAAEAVAGEKIWSGWKPVREALERLEAVADDDDIAAVSDDIAAANRYREAVGLPPVEKSQSDKLREALIDVNEREDVVVKEFDPEAGEFREIRMTEPEARKREMDFYRNGPPMQGHYTVEEWERMCGEEPMIAYVEGWNRLAIIDPGAGAGQPNYWLEGEGAPTETWKYDGDWVKVGLYAADKPPVADTRRVPQHIMDSLPEITEKEADALYEQHRGDSQEWVEQAEPSAGPIVKRVMFHNDIPVAVKKHRLDQFDHLPRMTPEEAHYHFTNVLKLSRYTRTTMDGYWGTVRGWRHPSTHENVAIEEFPGKRKMVGAPYDMAAAIAAGDWAEVARLAAELVD